MIGPQSIDFLKAEGYLVTSHAAFSVEELLACFRAFLAAAPAYQENYLQKQFGYGFDGYSYVGQPDSSNQAEDDLVSTFVFSNFYEVTCYPSEFQRFLKGGWHQVRQAIQTLEIEVIEQLNIPGLLDFYQQDVGHMVSNNYYPPLQNFATTAADNTRLSAHPDVSLFTVFPFGIDDHFELEQRHHSGPSTWLSLQASPLHDAAMPGSAAEAALSNSIVLFPGYLLELWSNGAIRALNHRVRLARDVTSERFSFAFFSLPFPQREFTLPGHGTMTSEAYFEAYLALF